MGLFRGRIEPETHPCDYCGREPEECICHLAGGFPDDTIDEIDTEYFDWGFYEEVPTEESEEEPTDEDGTEQDSA